ncbi:hypothetical protein Tco_0076371, partial [Tanacetum coccineum]
STSQPPVSPTSRRTTRQEFVVPQPIPPTQTPVADETASISVDVIYGGATTTVTGLEAGKGSGNIDKTPTMPHDSPLLRVNTLESDEGNLTQIKKVYGAAFIKLIKKVKRLEKKDRAVVLSDKEGSNSDILAQEDPSKQGRKIAQIDEDEGITLVQMGTQTQGRNGQDMEYDTSAFDSSEVFPVQRVSTASINFTTANVPITTTGTEISTASPEVKTVGDSGDDIAAKTLVYIRRSATKAKDKGKGIMEESESVMTKTKRQQEQERLGLEAAVRLQEEFDEEERQRIVRVHEAARSFTKEEWEDIRARDEASEELVQRLQ